MNTDLDNALKNTEYLDIRPATKKDIPLILEFIRLLAECNNSTRNLIATKEVLENSLFGEQSYAQVIIPYVDQKPAGYALFTYNFSTLSGKPTIYLVDLFVLEEMRSQGIGRKLIAYLANLAKEKDCSRLEWSVLQSNKQAISLYEKAGASPLNEWKSYRISGDSLDKIASEYKAFASKKRVNKS